MLNFKAVELTDRTVLEPVLQALPYRLYDHSFCCLYIWEKTYPAYFALEDGILYIQYRMPDEIVYQMPLAAGDRLAEAVHRLEADAAERGVPFSMIAINEQMKNELEEALPGRFLFTENPNQADYIYEAESLRELRGKKLHAKRNFVNRFLAANEGNFSVEPVGPENTEEVLAFNAEWDRAHGLTDDFRKEAEAIRRAVYHMEQIGMFGVALRLEGKIIAFALGSKLSADTLLEDIEKASDVPGAYQMINHEFACRFSEGFTYINREEDLGIEGLRKAKLSYFPAYLNMRWRAVPHE